MQYEDAKEFAENYGLEYFETSAKDGSNVDKIFNYAISQIAQKLDAEAWGADFDPEKYGMTK